MERTLDDIRSSAEGSFDFRGSPSQLSRRVTGISIDSRKISRDEVYVALRGDNHDGHDFVGEAFKKGAAAAIVEVSWWQNQGGSEAVKPVFLVPDTLTALQKLANDYRKRFSIPVVALTGTNGKTTTKEMVAAVLSKQGNVCKTEGNLNNHIGVPLTLFTLQQNHDFLVTEMGANHFGEIATLCQIAEPGYGLITNIGHAHLEFFGGLEGVVKAKMELFDYLATRGVIFVNIDDPLIRANTPPAKSRIDYGFRDEARVFGEILKPTKEGRARMKVQGKTISLNLAGDHNLSNALAAVAVGLEFGISLSKIKSALETVVIPDKRLQVYRKGKILVIDDSYNANRESTLSALRLLQQTETKGRRIFVFGDMLELGDVASQEHARIGEVLPDYQVDILFAFGPETAETVAKAQKANPNMTARHFTDKEELTAILGDTLRAGDALLVKGSRGMRMEEVLAAV